ncbi:MAG: hypothetical protein AAF735_05625 [Myxococcota bacterium]
MAIYVWNSDTQALELDRDALPYRSKWACFDCRKSFTRFRGSTDARVVCPDCASETVDMGFLFEPPPRRDTRTWRLMRTLADFGFRFHRSSSQVFIDRFLWDQKTLTPRRLKARLEQHASVGTQGERA